MKDRLNKISDLRLCMHLIGNNPPNMELFKQKIIEDNDIELLEALEAADLEILAEQAANAYIAARLEAYPAIGEQLDMLYKDMQNGTTNWQDLITQIKTDNPKG